MQLPQILSALPMHGLPGQVARTCPRYATSTQKPFPKTKPLPAAKSADGPQFFRPSISGTRARRRSPRGNSARLGAVQPFSAAPPRPHNARLGSILGPTLQRLWILRERDESGMPPPAAPAPACARAKDRWTTEWRAVRACARRGRSARPAVGRRRRSARSRQRSVRRGGTGRERGPASRCGGEGRLPWMLIFWGFAPSSVAGVRAPCRCDAATVVDSVRPTVW